MTHDPSAVRPVTRFPLVQIEKGEVDGLVAVIRRLSTARTLAEIMETVTHAARTLLHADGITFVLREGDLCHYAEEDAISPLWKGKRFPLDTCISGWCMTHGRAVAIADITVDDRIPQDAYRPTFVKSLAMVPVGHDEPTAALGAYWAVIHEATAEELDLLQTVANAAALATALVQVHEQKAVTRKLQRLAGKFAERLQDLSPAPVQALRGQPVPWTVQGKRLFIGFGCALAAYVARLALVPILGSEVPYGTFYLAVAGGVLWGRAAGGIAAAITGGILALSAFVAPASEKGFLGPAVWSLVVFWLVSAGLIYLIHRLLDAQTREHALNTKLQLIGEELQHRFKNFIAVTQALAVQTSRTSADHAEFRAKFTGRLQALGNAQSLLKQPEQSSVSLDELVTRSLDPFRHGNQFVIGSLPDALIDRDVATGLALVLNELATNALKHGALRTSEGQVLVESEAGQEGIRITWQEIGGPLLSQPPHPSFGTRLIQAAIPRGAGSTQIEYGKEGLICRIEFRPSTA